jgi:hypothetical protein
MKPLVDPPPDPVSPSVRFTAFVVAAFIAGVHLALAEDRYKEDAHYVGALFVVGALGLVVGAGLAAGGRQFGPPVVLMSWAMNAVIVAGMFVGFLLSRTVGLPSYHRHDWPVIQVLALVAEIGYLALATAAVRQRKWSTSPA